MSSGKGGSGTGRVHVASAPSILSLDLKRSLIGLCDLDVSFQGKVLEFLCSFEMCILLYPCQMIFKTTAPRLRK